MSAPNDPESQSYDDRFTDFDSPLMTQLRREAYGTDIGQHSWVTAEELTENIPRLELSRSSRILDLGCGPAGPLTFLLAQVGCHGWGIDVSAPAIAAGRARAASLGLESVVALQQADLNQPLPFPNATFDAVISFDVVLHLPDRLPVFREVARVLLPGGRFLFTDAGVITGAISDTEVRQRSVHGSTQFVSPDFNQRVLERAGLRLVDCRNRTANLLQSAPGRLEARLAHRAELEQLEGSIPFDRQQSYLQTVVALAEREALSRMMYLAKSPAA